MSRTTISLSQHLAAVAAATPQAARTQAPTTSIPEAPKAGAKPTTIPVQNAILDQLSHLTFVVTELAKRQVAQNVAPNGTLATEPLSFTLVIPTYEQTDVLAAWDLALATEALFTRQGQVAMLCMDWAAANSTGHMICTPAELCTVCGKVTIRPEPTSPVRACVTCASLHLRGAKRLTQKKSPIEYGGQSYESVEAFYAAMKAHERAFTRDGEADAEGLAYGIQNRILEIEAKRAHETARIDAAIAMIRDWDEALLEAQARAYLAAR
jgi:hypothetical protein